MAARPCGNSSGVSGSTPACPTGAFARGGLAIALAALLISCAVLLATRPRRSAQSNAAIGQSGLVPTANGRRGGTGPAPTPDALARDAFELVRAGKTAEGVAVYSQFLHRFPYRFDSALIAYERACAIYGGPMHINPPVLLAICKTYPTDSGAAQQVLYQLGESYIIENQYQEAVRVLRRVYNYRAHPDDKSYQPSIIAAAGSQMVVCYGILGQMDAANAALSDLKRRFPSNLDGSVTDAERFLNSERNQHAAARRH